MRKVVKGALMIVSNGMLIVGFLLVCFSLCCLDSHDLTPIFRISAVGAVATVIGGLIRKLGGYV